MGPSTGKQSLVARGNLDETLLGKCDRRKQFHRPFALEVAPETTWPAAASWRQDSFKIHATILHTDTLSKGTIAPSGFRDFSKTLSLAAARSEYCTSSVVQHATPSASTTYGN